LPPISIKGLPGNLLEENLAGIITMKDITLLIHLLLTF
jgi:hypothetical protein